MILGCPLTRLTLDECVAVAEEFIKSKTPHYIAVVNVAKLIQMRHDPALNQSVVRADVIGADGVPLVWASRLLGDPLPGRVNGTDLMYRLLERANQRNYRIFFFGAKEDVLERVLETVRVRYPGVRIAGWQQGYFSVQDEPMIVKHIRESCPDILLIGFSTPKKELWVKQYLHAMGVPVVHGVGGSFDVFAGVISRAPIWMQRCGLEWLFRLLQEPRRMWRRYLVTNTKFLALLTSEWLHYRLTARKNKIAHP